MKNDDIHDVFSEIISLGEAIKNFDSNTIKDQASLLQDSEKNLEIQKILELIDKYIDTIDKIKPLEFSKLKVVSDAKNEDEHDNSFLEMLKKIEELHSVVLKKAEELQEQVSMDKKKLKSRFKIIKTYIDQPLQQLRYTRKYFR
jgi:hypothetical protein